MAPPWARVFLTVILCLGLPAWAAPSPRQLGVLYEVRPALAPASQAPSYLLATIHAEDPRVLDLPPPVWSAFARSPGFAMEVIPDAKAVVKAMLAMTFTDGRTLREVLPASLYADTRAALEERGLTESAFKDFKPWAVVTLLSVPPSRTGDFLDMRLYRNALAAKKTVTGLETMEEQLAVFDSLDLCDQMAMLRETLDVVDRLPARLEALIRAYLAGDLDALQTESEAYLDSRDERLSALLWEAAVESRNRRMVDRMEPLLNQGGWFIAVGALHLPSPGGVLRLLERRGYRVTPVWN